jgi:hypothetical protein
MLYSIQNSYGEVYGIYKMPACTKSAEGLAHELKVELRDILGINGIRDAPLFTSETNSFEDRVVIDIEAGFRDREERLSRIHDTIGRLTVPTVED